MNVRIYDLSFNLESNRCISSGLTVSKKRFYDLLFSEIAMQSGTENADSNNFEISLIFTKEPGTFIYIDL